MYIKCKKHHLTQNMSNSVPFPFILPLTSSCVYYIYYIFLSI